MGNVVLYSKVGTDGLTRRERNCYAERYRRVAEAPVPLSTRVLAWARGEGYSLTPWQESLIRNMFDDKKADVMSEHLVELSQGDKARLIEWLRTGTGAWTPQSSSRLTIESVGTGGIFIRTRPWGGY